MSAVIGLYRSFDGWFGELADDSYQCSIFVSQSLVLIPEHLHRLTSRGTALTHVLVIHLSLTPLTNTLSLAFNMTCVSS